MPKFKPHKNRTSQPHPLSITIKFQPLFLLHLIASNIQHKGDQKEHIGILSRMATVTSAAVAIPSFTGLKAATATATKINASAKVTASPVPRCGVRASMKEVGVAVVATAASAMLASNAMALEILLGGDNGELAFVPSDFSAPAGEKIVFKNNAGFPHNVVFDEDEVPSGVDVSKISMGETDYLNGPGETYAVTLTEKGDYKFYCAPHQGAGMVGKVTIN